MCTTFGGTSPKSDWNYSLKDIVTIIVYGKAQDGLLHSRDKDVSTITDNGYLLSDFQSD
jgi:hypothetical protein